VPKDDHIINITKSGRGVIQFGPRPFRARTGSPDGEKGCETMKRMTISMKAGGTLLLILMVLTATAGSEETSVKIIFLHHSTGQNIWDGGVPGWFEKHNMENGTDYRIEERIFPKESPYGWNNYPYDYWNIWVAHGGDTPYMEEPTLEILAPEYDVIVFKHCFPCSDILEDTGSPDIASSDKRMENYMLQYGALKEKMRLFPDTRFIVWTPAPRAEDTSWRARLSAMLKGGSVQKANAARARKFAQWVRDVWDEPGDNIFVWDFFELGTEGGNFLKADYAQAPGNSHPSADYAKKAAPLLCRRIVDVIEGRGDTTDVTGR
jgi:hypothetical protein